VVSEVPSGQAPWHSLPTPPVDFEDDTVLVLKETNFRGQKGTIGVGRSEFKNNWTPVIQF